MTDREKLVELLAQSCEWRAKHCVGCKDDLPCAAECREEKFGRVADHLIANGVVVQTPKKPRQPTDLTGKCGSCGHAVPKNVGGSTCYVLCANPERRHMKRVEFARQRTYKACKMYKPLPEPLESSDQEHGEGVR